MGYLVTHIAACLIFAQLLGLLLGWLLWGYLARQRAIEVQSLRERIADMQVLTPRMAFAGQQRTPISASPSAILTGPLAGGDVPSPSKEGAEALPKPSSVQDDLAAEVKEARLQHYEKQVRELEGVRDRLPLLQADLSNAIAARRSAETKLEETKNDSEVRISNLLGQVRDFERAAQEWDRIRDEFERSDMAKERELSSVRSHLRDLQNNQLPQKAETSAPAGVSALEHTDLRERYQKALKERDSIAAQFESWKQSGSAQNEGSARLAELEEALRNKDEQLAEQLAQVETLLWRVAEMEPFAASAPRMEEDLRRQESEIAGHVAMHAESSDHIRSLLNRLAEQESESSGRINELLQTVADRAVHIEQRDARIGELQTELDRVTEQQSAQKALQAESADQIRLLSNRLAEREARIEQDHSRIVELQTELDRLTEQHSAQKALQAESADQIRSLLNRLAEQESERQEMVAERDARIGELQTELDRLTEQHSAQKALQADSAEQIRSLSNRLAEQESESSGRTNELQRMVAAREAHIDQRNARMAELQTELDRLAQEHSEHARQLHSELAEHREALATAQRDHSSTISDFKSRLAIFEAESRRALDLEKQLADRSSEILGLSAAFDDLQSELHSWKSRTEELEPLAAKASWLEKEVSGQALEIRRLQEVNTEKNALLTDLHQRLLELEPLASRLPEAEQKLALQEERHQAERSQLKVNSALRIRRLRQSMNTFKG